jgi:cytochrome c-type biogenesis protein CcmH/NrfF
MKRLVIILLTVTIVALLTPSTGMGQTDFENQLSDLRERVEKLESNVDSSTAGIPGVVVFLFGAFCALWAQNTRRNAWLWFFLGIFFNIITVIVLLWKNSQDRKQLQASNNSV